MSEELAKKIAREIFELGDEPNSPTQRLSFVGGKWPDNEKHQGGIAEYPLMRLIEKVLNDHKGETL